MSDIPMSESATAATTDSPTSSIRFRNILVTTDFSEASRQAMPWAAEFAVQFGARLTLAYVFPTNLPAELSHIGIVLEQKRLAAESRGQLLRFREQELPARLPVEIVVLEGGPAHEIIRLARDSEADLILMATHGHTGLKHLWLGSTTERVVRHAPCPVLVVREQPVPIRFPGAVLCRFQRILVPTDFSAAGSQALRCAAAFAQPCGGEITLAHVIEPPSYPEFGYAHIPAKEARLKQQARKKLDEHCAELTAVGVKTTPVVRHGSAFHEITEHAREIGANLIIIASHRHNAIARALLGSTAERVVRHAPCPVLVVREREPVAPGPLPPSGRRT